MNTQQTQPSTLLGANSNAPGAQSQSAAPTFMGARHNDSSDLVLTHLDSPTADLLRANVISQIAPEAQNTSTSGYNEDLEPEVKKKKFEQSKQIHSLKCQLVEEKCGNWLLETKMNDWGTEIVQLVEEKNRDQKRIVELKEAMDEKDGRIMELERAIWEHRTVTARENWKIQEEIQKMVLEKNRETRDFESIVAQIQPASQQTPAMLQNRITEQSRGLNGKRKWHVLRGSSVVELDDSELEMRMMASKSSLNQKLTEAQEEVEETEIGETGDIKKLRDPLAALESARVDLHQNLEDVQAEVESLNNEEKDMEAGIDDVEASETSRHDAEQNVQKSTDPNWLAEFEKLVMDGKSKRFMRVMEGPHGGRLFVISSSEEEVDDLKKKLMEAEELELQMAEIEGENAALEEECQELKNQNFELQKEVEAWKRKKAPSELEAQIRALREKLRVSEHQNQQMQMEIQAFGQWEDKKAGMELQVLNLKDEKKDAEKMVLNMESQGTKAIEGLLDTLANKTTEIQILHAQIAEKNARIVTLETDNVLFTAVNAIALQLLLNYLTNNNAQLDNVPIDGQGTVRGPAGTE